MAPTEILERLHDRFRLLTGGSRTVARRHQTLRATVDWSYDLLDTGEKALFRRLSVFAGSWRMASAEAVCGGDGADADVPEWQDAWLLEWFWRSLTPAFETLSNDAAARTSQGRSSDSGRGARLRGHR